MPASRSPLFCGTGLAGRIERAEAQLMAEASRAARRRRADAAGFVIPVGGGVASFAEPATMRLRIRFSRSLTAGNFRPGGPA